MRDTRKKFRKQGGRALLLLLITMALGTSAQAARISDVSSTKHNLSSLSGNSVRAADKESGGTDEICVFCHTPHAANTVVAPSPLWNRIPSDQSYVPYSSTSLDYRDLFYSTYPGGTYADAFQPDGNSKLCLSCHDGTIALGSVTNKPGSGGYDAGGNLSDLIAMSASTETDGTISPNYRDTSGNMSYQQSGESLVNSGFTRRIGTDLTNDHPISFTFDTELADRDGELADPSLSAVIVVGKAQKGQLPLQVVDGKTKMQCTTCHDPHVRDDGATGITWNVKFLRLNRFQAPQYIDTSLGGDDTSSYDVAPPYLVADSDGDPLPSLGIPVIGTFKEDQDILCLACHEKAGWAESVHADPIAGDEIYKDWAADQREFPRGIRVWQASCMNCHDNHSVQGARRLLREGTCDGFDADGACSDSNFDIKNGGDAAVEETCFQCHTNADRNSILLRKPSVLDTICDLDGTNCVDVDAYGDVVPDIETEFLDGIRMPITSDDQGVTLEIHSIGTADWASQAGKDLLESQEKLGLYNLDNRHVECSDCHNPHRVTRNAVFSGEGDEQRTHKHAQSEIHNNLASGALRGTWGIEPQFSGEWYDLQSPSTAWVKRGLAPPGTKINGDGDTMSFDIRERDSNGDWVTVTYEAPNYESHELEAARGDTFVTREYQLCLRCHSNFTYDDDGKWQSGEYVSSSNTGSDDTGSSSSRPSLENQGGGTPKSPYPNYDIVGSSSSSYNSDGSNGVTQYTNQLTEFNVRANDYLSGVDQGERDGDSGPSGTVLYDGSKPIMEPPQSNHRSWHPVIFPTGRDGGERTMQCGTGRKRDRCSFIDPFANGFGSLTMYCSDCHGSAYGGSVCVSYRYRDGRLRCREWGVAPGRGVWGPHGSSNEFMLRGEWSINTGKDASLRRNPEGATHLCFNCHQSRNYARQGDGSSRGTGFSKGDDDNLHTFHSDEAGKDNWRCTMCHIAIPHGWKNKAFLANTLSVGPEGGAPPGTTMDVFGDHSYGKSKTYYAPPYYLHSIFGFNSFARSGDWRESNCENMEKACDDD